MTATAVAEKADATRPVRLLRHVWDRLGAEPGSVQQAAKGREVPGTLIIVGIGIAFGLVATFISWQQGWMLLYADAQSHLVIARRVLDSQNTGFQQLGTVWLPMPHILLMPFVQNFQLWQSGLAGGLLGASCLGVSAGALWRITFRAGFNRPARLVTVAVLLLNPSILYLFTTALTEPVLFAALLSALAGLSGWITAMPSISPGELAVFAGIPTAVAVLSRYEGWAFVVVGATFVIIASWRRWRSASYTVTLVLSYIAAPAAAVIWWVSYNFVRYGDPLDFARGPYSAAAQQQDLTDLGLLPTKGNLGLAVRTFDWNIVNIIGPALLIIAAIGAVLILWLRGTSTTALILWIPAFVYPFALLSLYLGQTVIRNDVSMPIGLFNIRYAALLVPLVAVLVGAVVDVAWRQIPRFATAVTAVVVAVIIGFMGWTALNPTQNMGVIREGYLINSGSPDSVIAANWLGDHYEGGYILIDDTNSQALLPMGVPLDQLYSSFNGESFDDALAAPYQYVSWVFANTENENDRVWKAIQADPDFDARFFPVFQSGPFTVWQSAKTIGPIS